MVSNKQQAENFVKACMYPPNGYRSYGPIRGLLYGGSDYPEKADDEILKLAMIETKEALENLDEILSTKGLDGVYIGPSAALNVVGAVKLARLLAEGANVVTILCDGGDRYKSKLYNQEWLKEKGLTPQNEGNNLDFME